MQTVSCASCGASTPVPDDLSTATFPCEACGERLVTAGVVGLAVTSADAFVQGVRATLAGKETGPLASPVGPGAPDTTPYASDVERMRAALQKQVEENERLRRVRGSTITCPQCGGQTTVPSTGVQVPCTFCGAAILVSGTVGESAVAREHLGRGVRAAIHEAVAERERKKRREAWMIGLGIAAFFVVVFGGGAVVSVLASLFAALR